MFFCVLTMKKRRPKRTGVFVSYQTRVSLGHAGVIGWAAAATRLRSVEELWRTLAIPTLLAAGFLVALWTSIVEMRAFTVGMHLLTWLRLAIVRLAWRVAAVACACAVLFGVTNVIAVSVMGPVMTSAMPLAGAVPGTLAFVRPPMCLVPLTPGFIAFAAGAIAPIASRVMGGVMALMRCGSTTIGGPFAAFVLRPRSRAVVAPGLAIELNASRAILALSGAGGPVIAWVIVRLIPATLAATVRAAAMACALTGVAAVVAVGVLAPARCGSNGFSANIVDQFNRLLHELFDGFDLAFFGRIAQ